MIALGTACLQRVYIAAKWLAHALVDCSTVSALQGGIYHGRILLPSEYPFKPPSFLMLTPNGRFETGVKVCPQRQHGDTLADVRLCRLGVCHLCRRRLKGLWHSLSQVCLSISSHHPEHWQPSWSLRTALVALIAFMQTPGNGAIGSLVRLQSGC
jgi:ubiquitin-conjugating enzyme E2 J1